MRNPVSSLDAAWPRTPEIFLFLLKTATQQDPHHLFKMKEAAVQMQSDMAGIFKIKFISKFSEW